MKKSQRGFAIPIIIAIVALLAIGGGAYIYTNNKAEVPAKISDTVNITSTTSNEVKIVATTTNISVISKLWSKYIDDRSLFQVNYPKGWTTYKVKVQDASVGGVNIYPDESIPSYTQNNKLTFDWSAYFLPFNQHNGEYPIISIGGQATYDYYQSRSQYDFKKTFQYQTIIQYLNGWKQSGTITNLQLEDTSIQNEPTLIATFEDTSKNSKVFYMFKLAKDSITEKSPATVYFIVQYIAPKDKYSDEIAATLKTSFQDSLSDIAKTSKEIENKSAVSTSTKSKGNVFQVAVAGPVGDETNLLKFDYSFDKKVGAEGLLTVYWDDKVIGSLDSRADENGQASFLAPVGKSYKDKSFTVVFRLDSFTDIPSSISIGNAGLYFVESINSDSPEIKKVGEISQDSFMPYQPTSKTPFGTVRVSK